MSAVLTRLDDLIAPHSSAPSRFLAPARFDTHVVRGFEQWAASRHLDHDLVVDLTAVVFIDLDAVEALIAVDQRRAGWGGSLRIDNPSAAVSITLDMLGLGSSQFAMAA